MHPTNPLLASLLTLSLFSLGNAQNLTGLPACAVTCFENNFVNTKCASTNIACLCGDKTFFTDVEVCVVGGCNAADTGATLTWATNECAAAGVPLSKKRSIFGRKH